MPRASAWFAEVPQVEVLS